MNSIIEAQQDYFENIPFSRRPWFKNEVDESVYWDRKIQNDCQKERWHDMRMIIRPRRTGFSFDTNYQKDDWAYDLWMKNKHSGQTECDHLGNCNWPYCTYKNCINNYL